MTLCCVYVIYLHVNMIVLCIYEYLCVTYLCAYVLYECIHVFMHGTSFRVAHITIHHVIMCAISMPIYRTITG